jgi:hypothetical protein
MGMILSIYSTYFCEAGIIVESQSSNIIGILIAVLNLVGAIISLIKSVEPQEPNKPRRRINWWAIAAIIFALFSVASISWIVADILITPEIEITEVASPVSPGQYATLEAKATPGALCDIDVIYESGASYTEGLENKKADSDGKVSWTWKVGTSMTPGTWPIKVTASYREEAASDSSQFEVIPPDPTIEITQVTSPVSQGQTATLETKATPGALCDIDVIYASGPGTAKGLEDKIADSDGNVSWTWRVGGNTTPGTWPINVTASLGEESASDSTSFVVR